MYFVQASLVWSYIFKILLITKTLSLKRIFLSYLCFLLYYFNSLLPRDAYCLLCTILSLYILNNCERNKDGFVNTRISFIFQLEGKEFLFQIQNTRRRTSLHFFLLKCYLITFSIPQNWCTFTIFGYFMIPHPPSNRTW